MLEFLKKHNWVMLILMALFLLGILFTLNEFSAIDKQQSSKKWKINGKTYSHRDFIKQGVNAAKIVQEVGLTQLYYYLGNYNPYAQTLDEEAFFANRILLQQAGKTFGISPSKEAIHSYLKSQLFIDQTQKLSPVAYRNYIKNRLGIYGYSEQNFQQLVSDQLLLKKLLQLFSVGFASNEPLISKRILNRHQNLELKIKTFSTKDLKTLTEPSTEELKKYWEENKQQYQSPEKRSLSYVVLTAAPNQAVLESAKKIGAFSDKLYQKGNPTFEQLANEFKLPFKQIPASSIRQLPEILKPALQGRNKRLSDVIFSLPWSEDKLDRLSDPLQNKQGDWIIFRLDSIIPPSILSFEEAKITAKTHWIENQAQIKLLELARTFQEKIAKRLTTGEAFEKISETRQFEKLPFIGQKKSLENSPINTLLLFEKASNTPINRMSPPLVEDRQVTLVYVIDRTFPHLETMGKEFEQMTTSEPWKFQSYYFLDWLGQQSLKN